MPGFLGTLLIGLIVAGWAALAVRSLWRSRKSACGCGGSCAACGGCSGKGTSIDGTDKTETGS